MGTLVEKINYLKETKTAIKNAITAKGVSVSDTDTFRSYAGKIGEIQSGSSGGGSENNAFFDFSKYTNSYLYKVISFIDFSSLDTSKVTNMQYMFSGLAGLESLDLSSFNTSKVKNMSHMFYNCNKLGSVNLSSFDTSNVTNMSGMFQNCFAMRNLDLRNFNTSKVTDMSNMFSYCNAQTLDLSSFNTTNVTNMDNMFISEFAPDLILGDNWASNEKIMKFDLSQISLSSPEPFDDSSIKRIHTALATRTNSPSIIYPNILVWDWSVVTIATNKGWDVIGLDLM